MHLTFTDARQRFAVASNGTGAVPHSAVGPDEGLPETQPGPCVDVSLADAVHRYLCARRCVLGVTRGTGQPSKKSLAVDNQPAVITLAAYAPYDTTVNEIK